MARFDLASACRKFAGDLQTTLNRTVTDDARIVPLQQSDVLGVVGTNFGRSLSTQRVPLRSASPNYQCWLDVLVTLYCDGEYLTVKQSYFAVHAGPDESDILFHYDYERDKAGYTEAHLQIFGKNDLLDPMMLELCVTRKKKTMGELHLPVGGRRFRPALEDVVEFLIDENLADPKDGWKAALDEGRDRFREIQLKAAVRKNPDAAAEALQALGYTVSAPVQTRAPKIRGKSRTR